MTRDLQQALAAARDTEAGTTTPLTTHGVDFGHIETLEGGAVQIHPDGIGFEDNAGRPPEEVLVVRPFVRAQGAELLDAGLQPETPFSSTSACSRWRSPVNARTRTATGCSTRFRWST